MRKGGKRFGRSGAALGAALLATAGFPAIAVGQQAQGMPSERTGPMAQPPALPDYAEPTALDGGVAEQVRPVQTMRYEGAFFTDVRVETEGEGIARPVPAWQPDAADPAGLRLSHTGSDPFDAVWVERQFVTNGLVGSSVDMGRVVALTQLVNRAFVNNGYANSGVLIDGSTRNGQALVLRLVLGSLGEMSEGIAIGWVGDDSAGLNERYVIERLPSALSRPFNVFAFERDFRLLAHDRAIDSVDAGLRPGERPGAANLSMLVRPKDRFDLYFGAANNRAPSVGGLRLAAGGSMRNPLLAGDLLSAEIGFTDGLTDGIASYEAPVFDPHTFLILRAAFNDVAVVEQRLADLDIESREWSVEGGISRRLVDSPLIPESGGWSPARSLDIGVLLAHRRTKTYLLGEPFSFSPGAVNGRAEYTALRFTQDYVEQGTRHVLAISLTETVGLDGTRPTAPGVLKPNRNFVAVLGQASFAQRLTNRLELNLRLAGQYSSGTLYSGERFSIGGENSVRGYRENLLLADRALFASAELAYSLSLTGMTAGAPAFDWGAFRLAIFADGAIADNSEQPEPFPDDVASVGASLAWVPSRAIFARISYGEALRDPQLAGKRYLQDRGVQFRITLRPLEF
ncbi:hypothetical protein GCM10011371_30080 [Novosphingobium marinum]|uniref:Hemolysin activation/secretion protein n=1 Tax=Novosphingobium marinum TaxID=1514948 RepID=A0A7Y9XYD6_9SPHN|nr:ShlB/FhaC/HecB family hemolysin secretion/activation protein [Novosphingobium marinum]NYH96730.1 hemolysin activation/secretion protein [Novosphingobium marinum]GGC40643.1 hypothetical protein GCM10011371_30080 [Novosphingobium marinum]